MVAKVILNPYSSRWQAGELWYQVAPLLRDAGVNFQVALSQEKGHSMELAADAVRAGFSPIIAAGGDGTIGDVVNGMMQAVDGDETLPPLGILPLGTANDLAANLGIPKSIEKACAVIGEGKMRMLDIASVNGRYFVNNAALGLEPLVTVLQEDIEWLQGVPRYLYAALKAIRRGTSWHVDMDWDDGSYHGLISLISVGNGARTGGLFYMTPHANLFDGKLTFTFGYVKSRLKLLRLLPRTMASGKGNIVECDEVFEHHTTRLHVKLSAPSPTHADGELFSAAIVEADYQIYPMHLPVFMP